MRQGPPYRSDTGGLDLTSSTITYQVILDDLASCDATAFQLVYSSSPSTTSLSRDIDITIRQNSGVVTSFSGRTGSNSLYADNQPNTTISFNGICHIKQLTTGGYDTSTCSATDRRIYYFSGKRSAYANTLSSSPPWSCTPTSCPIGSVTIKDANLEAIVFADQEVRP